DRAVLMGQRDVAEASALAERCDLVVVGIGTSVDQAELVTSGMVDIGEMRDIARSGGVGEMLGHFFEASGRAVDTGLTRRILTLPLTALKGRRIVAVAGGEVKVPAIRAVLASGLLSGLITDERTARAIMDLMRDPAAAGSARAAEVTT
ncbi:MAG: sugar-binding domain-containing protein, partial [Albidovulum sp.]